MKNTVSGWFYCYFGCNPQFLNYALVDDINFYGYVSGKVGLLKLKKIIYLELKHILIFDTQNIIYKNIMNLL